MGEGDATGPLAQALAHAERLLASHPALAVEQAAEILAAAPGHPVARLLQAAGCNALGRHAEALALAAPLAAAHPSWARAHLEHGQALAGTGRADDGIVAMRHALALKPDMPGGWRILADVLQASGDTDAAGQAYARHVRHSTRDPGLLQAAAALCDDRIPEAEALLRAHLGRAPTDVAAIRMLAEVAARLGRDDDALQLLARCLELAPGFHAARHNHALILNRCNRHAEALAEAELLLAAAPGNASYRNLKAVILSRIGDATQAIELYEALVAEHPAHPRLWTSHGHALKTAGFQPRAIDAYRRAIALDPGHGEAWWSLAHLKTFRFDADDIVVMRQQLQRPGLTQEARHHLEFALGKALEDEGDYAASFRHYLAGNTLRKATAPHDPDDITARMRRARQVYTREFFEARAGAGSQARDPIFIVGLPRAGSTLVEQILSSHSAVEGTMELPEVIAITRELRQRSASPWATSHGATAGARFGGRPAVRPRPPCPCDPSQGRRNPDTT
ncbi:tetratricopeptide repeat-containing sulfotransferase family protein [Cognatiluteimonas telluris]|jgi:predicted Zn-dependent protease|uniref:tetratricopeptide repeat-containing sulfotransferase family protein n=1 Tax=Cognatiluteimonas telluris TaxID=1104775 RepID=UPI00140D1BD3|nr:tetratricopeptide repeat-containing sulfotransferase family protein [Lysobacter telluris]